MKLTIKYLSKHEVFAALYNYTAEFERRSSFSVPGFAMGTEQINLIKAEQIIKTQLEMKHSLYFDYFNADLCQKDIKQANFGNRLHIDLTENVIEPEKFDAVYGPGKCEELINDLRKQKIAHIKDQLRPVEPQAGDWISELFGVLPQPKKPQELIDILSELEVQVQQYERIVGLERKLDRLMDRAKPASSGVKPPFFPLVSPDNPAPRKGCEPSAAARP
jgi:hypothetical protein